MKRNIPFLRGIFLVLFSILIAGMVISPHIPLKALEGVLLVLLACVANSWNNKRIEMRLLEQKYRCNNEILDDIFKHSPDLIFFKDMQYKYFGCNESFAKKHRMSKNEIIGKTDFDIFLSQESAVDIRKIDEEVLRDKKTRSYEQAIVIKNGKELIYDTVKSPLFDDAGEIYGILGISRDITKIKETHAQKENFVATLTHDLKTPTIAQIKILELFLSGAYGEFSDSQKEMLGLTLNSCKYMLDMIMTVISTYKYEDGVKVLAKEEFNFSSLIQSVVDELGFMTSEKSLSIEFKNNGKTIVEADKLEIKRVIMNLISNAISYSTPGTVINIDAFNFTLGGVNKMIFKVTNVAEPMSDEDFKLLFQKYSSGAKRFGVVGTGLGLYLSKQIIEAHSGEMLVERLPVGNAFGFMLNCVDCSSLSTIGEYDYQAACFVK